MNGFSADPGERTARVRSNEPPRASPPRPSPGTIPRISRVFASATSSASEARGGSVVSRCAASCSSASCNGRSSVVAMRGAAGRPAKAWMAWRGSGTRADGTGQSAGAMVSAMAAGPVVVAGPAACIGSAAVAGPAPLTGAAPIACSAMATNPASVARPAVVAGSAAAIALARAGGPAPVAARMRLRSASALSGWRSGRSASGRRGMATSSAASAGASRCGEVPNHARLPARTPSRLPPIGARVSQMPRISRLL